MGDGMPLYGSRNVLNNPLVTVAGWRAGEQYVTRLTHPFKAHDGGGVKHS